MSIVKGADVAKKMTEELQAEVVKLKDKGIHPRAVVVRVGDNPSCIAYGKGATKKLESVLHRFRIDKDIHSRTF